MATQTEYYELNKPAGTDLVNPLVDTNPNWDKLDASLHELNTRSIANATEVVALGVHAISRLNTYTKFIRWIATANFNAGDTFTVDGNVVAASTPAGATLETNAYVTGAVVLACLNADDSAMTIFVAGTTVASDSLKLGGELPSYYATAAALGSAETDIDNIQALNGTTSIASIGDGTLTGAVSAINNMLTDVWNYLDISNYGKTTVFNEDDYKFIVIELINFENENYITAIRVPTVELINLGVCTTNYYYDSTHIWHFGLTRQSKNNFTIITPADGFRGVKIYGIS